MLELLDKKPMQNLNPLLTAIALYINIQFGINIFTGVSLFSAHGFVQECAFYISAVFGSGWLVIKFLKALQEYREGIRPPFGTKGRKDD